MATVVCADVGDTEAESMTNSSVLLKGKEASWKVMARLDSGD